MNKHWHYTPSDIYDIIHSVRVDNVNLENIIICLPTCCDNCNHCVSNTITIQDYSYDLPIEHLSVQCPVCDKNVYLESVTSNKDKINNMGLLPLHKCSNCFNELPNFINQYNCPYCNYTNTCTECGTNINCGNYKHMCNQLCEDCNSHQNQTTHTNYVLKTLYAEKLSDCKIYEDDNYQIPTKILVIKPPIPCICTENSGRNATDTFFFKNMWSITSVIIPNKHYFMSLIDFHKDVQFNNCEHCGREFKTDVYFVDLDKHPLQNLGEENLHECWYCGKNYPKIFSQNSCPYCNTIQLCFGCNTTLTNDNTFTEDIPSNRIYCTDCGETLFAQCENCRRFYYEFDLLDGYCRTCYNNDGDDDYDDDGDNDDRIRNFDYKPTFNFNQVGDSNLYFGIELELELHSDNCFTPVLDLFDKYKPDIETIQHPIFYFKYDGSIEQGFEVVSHPCNLKCWQYMKQDLKILCDTVEKEYGDADKQGMHVHITRKGVTPEQEVRLVHFMWRNKDFIEFIASRNNENYAKIKKEKDYDRYSAVNFCNDTTIEIRIFRGTLDIDRILANIEFCHALYIFTKNERDAFLSTQQNIILETFLTFLNGWKDTYPHLYQRIENNKLYSKYLK